MRELRDSLAICIALMAAAFTCWQAWEAHQARKDAQDQFNKAQDQASKSADQARKDSQIALDAQTKLADRSAEQAKRSADASVTANKIASNALYISHRPWVGLDGSVQFPEQPRFEIYPTNRSIHLSVRYMVKNFGGAPALNSSSYAMIFAEKGIPKRPEIPMNTACSFADDDRKNKRGAVIFPNQPVRAGSDPGTTFDPTMHTIGQIWVVICTSYGDDTGKIHHTKTWALTQPPKDAQPVIAVPGNPLLYYPVFEAQIFDEEID
ncbi:MAG TPA: hypothetical protein VK937_14635 [Candidatus Limnocylindria bacterium]|nr:hypothetical protein [Candidatus Limnocylindria bacterium]